MKTSVRNMMMSLVLMGGMILSVPASAQFSSSRQRPSAARGASVSAQSRSSESRQSVSRSSESRSARSERQPQVSRSASERQPQVSRSTSERPSTATRSTQGSMRGRNESSRVSVSPQSQTRTTTPQVQQRSAARSLLTATRAAVSPPAHAEARAVAQWAPCAQAVNVPARRCATMVPCRAPLSLRSITRTWMTNVADAAATTVVAMVV